MTLKKLALLTLLVLPQLTFAGEISINCDSRVVGEKACIALLHNSLKALDCSINTDIRCLLHPWGSDFVKSWICSAQSTSCSIALQDTCPQGTTRAFNETMAVCGPTKKAPAVFHGICRHEMAAHSVAVKSCDEQAAACAKFGGTPSQCNQPEGYNSWEVSCNFPSLEISESGPSCNELKSKCEQINSDKGARGTLLNCF